MSYATLAELKRYIELPPSNTIDDDLLTAALESATSIIDNETHRTFAAPADSTRGHDAIKDVEGRRLWLRGDLAQLTSVTIEGAAVSLPALVNEPGIPNEPTYALTLKNSSGKSWAYGQDAEGAIAVTGRWAYSVTPPAAVAQATKRLAAWLYRQRDNALDLDRTMIVGNTVIAAAAIPADIVLMLRPYKARL